MNYTDMTKEQLLNQLKEMEQRLSQAEASARQYRDTLEALGDAISIQDTDFKILYQNQAHINMIGDHAGNYCYKAYNNFDSVCKGCPVAMSFQDGKIHTIEKKGAPHKGISDVEITASPLKDGTGKIIAGIEAVRDISERKKMETERVRIQDLESLGVFASGVAHEYNNLLTAIIGNLSLAKMYAKPGYEVYDVLAEAEKASIRAKDLTSQLLVFAEGSRTVKKIIYLKEPLKDWVRSALSNSQVRPEISVQEDLRPIEADELQLHQVIDNIVTNARESMSGGGVIKVKAQNIDIDSPSVLPLEKGKYVLLSIEDSGIGIPQKHLLHIFDPFYSTKQENSGLGLANAYSIIKEHHGHITVDSKLGVGTIYHIYLPAFQKISSPSEEALKTYPSGKGRILVMDDEEIVRLVISKLLSQCGYETELARNGEEMLTMYKAARESGQPFSAVIMDLVIEGGMGGQEAIKYLLKLDPGAKAIVSSGYSNAPVMSHFKEFGFIGFLAKPYRIEELGNVLHEVLTEEGA